MERHEAGTRIPLGTEVYGADDEKVGQVIAGSDRYIVVEKGFFFPTDYYIPVDAIARYDGQRIYLTATKDEALHAGWDERPDDDALTTDVADFDASGTATYVADQEALRAETGAAGVRAHMGESADTPGLAGDLTRRHGEDGEPEADADAMPAQAVATAVQTDDTIHIPLHEEELVARKRTRQTGDAWIVKGVVEEARELDVPVTEERAKVTRRTIDRDLETGEVVFEETTMTVPLSRDEVEVDRRTRVTEEAVIEKEPVQRTERVRGTVRKERLAVEGEALPADPNAPERTDSR